MKTINDLPEKTFWQPGGKIRQDLKDLAMEAIVELKREHRHNACSAIVELFNII